jgi:hypothetical protein
MAEWVVAVLVQVANAYALRADTVSRISRASPAIRRSVPNADRR